MLFSTLGISWPGAAPPFLILGLLLVAVAHGSWCVWTAAREPYQLDAETDSSDQEGWEESFVAFSLPHVAPAKTK